MVPPPLLTGLFDSHHVVTAYGIGDDDVAGVTHRAYAHLAYGRNRAPGRAQPATFGAVCRS